MNTPCLSLRILAALGVVSFGLAWGLPGSEEDPGGREDTGALVLQLGANEFSRRKAASRRLWELGRAALPALREACGSEDPEIRVRARKIVADLEIGIFVDTPPETVALIREFHSGGLKEKEAVLRQLRGGQHALARIRLLLSEKNPEWRTKFVREFAGTWDVVLTALREAGQLEVAEDLLARLSPRNWAAYLLLEGRAEAVLTTLTAKGKQGVGAAERPQLFWLLVVTDQLPEARAVAEQSGETALRREVYLRQRDWGALVEEGWAEVGNHPVENLGFKAWFLAKAGDAEGAREAVDDLVALEIVDDRMADKRSAALVILGRFDLATTSFGKPDGLDVNEFGFYLERFQFEKLAARLGVGPAAQELGEAMRGRVEKVLKEEEGNAGRTARRELFNLSRSVGEFLMRAGEKAEAGAVFRACRELVRDEPSYLAYLASTCRRAGLIELAESLELGALKIGGKTHYLSGRFPHDRDMAQFWWEYLRSQNPDEAERERLQRVSEILGQAEGEGRKDLDALVAEALEWVEKQRGDERAKHYGALAAHHRRLEQWKAAARFFRKQSELSTKPASALVEAGDMFANEGRWDEAAAFYADAVQADPGNELAVYLHGRALVEDGEQEEGKARMATALRMPLTNANRRNILASGLLRRGLADAAREQWQFVIKTAEHDDWDGTAFWALRTARSQLLASTAEENPALAADCQETYLMGFLKTNTAMTMRSYLSYLARIEALRFEVAIAEGRIEDAVMHVRRAMEAQPGNTNLVFNAVDRLTEMGRNEVAEELCSPLAERYAGLVERFPKSAQFHNTLGEVHFRMGNRGKAIAAAKRCLELEPDSVEYRNQLDAFSSEEGEAEQP